MTKNRLGVVLVTVSLCLAWQAGTASATTLTFDDLGGLYEPIPSGYGGLDWFNFYTLDAMDPANGPGFANGMVSPRNVAYNGFGAQALAFKVVSNSLFDFNGAYLAAGFLDGLNIEVTGFAGGPALHSKTVVVDTSRPTFFSFDFAGIDTLQFTAFGGELAEFAAEFGCDETCTFFAMDNFTLDEPVSAIPEPATLALLGTGLTALAGRLRRRARREV